MSSITAPRSERLQSEALTDRSGPNPIFCAALSKIFTAYLAPAGGLTVIGAINIPGEGSYIVAPNHISQLDTAVVGKAVLDATNRNLHFMAKAEYWRGRYGGVTGRFVENGGGFGIERGNSFDKQPAVRERLENIFNAGDPLCLYPQGTRMGKEPITKLKAGIGLLAVKYDVPVIPVGLAGTLERDHMTVIFGEPMRAEHVDFDLGDSHAIREVSGIAGAFRRDLAVRMQDLRLQAEAVRSWAMAA